MSKQEILLSNSAIEFLKDEIGGGTNVVANPTLVGTEAVLTGLQVGDTKYAVPQGGGGGAGIEFVEITVESESGTLTSEQATALLNGAFLKITNENYIASIIPLTYRTLSITNGEVVGTDLYYNFRNFNNNVITEILICVTIELKSLTATYKIEFYTHNVTPIQPPQE